MMDLLSLPNEMLVEVAGYLDNHSKARLAQTCKHLHSLVTRELYRDLTIDMFYHASAPNDTRSLCIAPSKEKGNKRIQSPINLLERYGPEVRNLTIRVSRMPDSYTKTQANNSRVSMKRIKSAILKCTGTTKLRILSGYDVGSQNLPGEIYQPFELFYPLLEIAESATASFQYLKEVVIAGLADIDSFNKSRVALQGPCDLTLAMVNSLSFEVNIRAIEDRVALWKQISGALDGVRATIHFGNLDPASRKYRFVQNNGIQGDYWQRKVRRLNATIDALSPERTPGISSRDVHSLNILSFPTDKLSYEDIIPRTARFQELKELWVLQYQTGLEPIIPWEETFPGLAKSLPNLEGITYRRFFRDSDKTHQGGWRMVEKRFKVDRKGETVAPYSSVRDEFYKAM
ncbi:hypothetical protein TWF481_010819 [Arthrobotrys musiformis]|uniref:F-box domain-containing protein n=1 Tax=Arthrobotrys musiformis TaxID=47236 RepID=A0AAV9W3R8_9PEZI